MRTWILILMLLLASSLQAQEFTVVGDHANRDPDSSWYGVDLTATNQWTAIDDLHCNWLKLSVEASSPHSSEQMLEHPGYLSLPKIGYDDKEKARWQSGHAASSVD